MGVVMTASHIVIGSQYAIKLLSPQLINDSSWQRFQSEARTMAALSHPTFVKVYDLGLHDNSLPFYAMDLLKGKSLETAIIEKGYLPLNDTINIFRQVLDGLAYAHRNGIIHRDLKPSNIFLCHNGQAAEGDGPLQVKILDFGIAKSNGKASLHEQSLTKNAEDVIGSPCYMSPEHCRGEEVDARSDIYSIGCALYETLTGFVPFEAATAFETLTMQEEYEPLPVSEINPECNLPQSIDLVVAKCLAKLTQNRYQTAKELALDLIRVQEGKDLHPFFASSTKVINAASASSKLNNRNRKWPWNSNAGFIFGTTGKEQRAFIFTVAILASIAIAATVYMNLAPNRVGDNPLSSPLSSPLSQISGLQKTGAHNTIGVESAHQASEISALANLEQTKSQYGSIPGNSQTESTKYSTFRRINGREYRCFSFPKDISLGYIQGRGLEVSEQATGNLEFPKELTLALQPNPLIEKYPQYLLRFQPGDLVEVDMDFSRASDKLLLAVSNIPGIQILNLAGCKTLTPECYSTLNKFVDLKAFQANSSSLSGRTLARANCWQHLRQLLWNDAIEPTPLLRKIQSSPELLELWLNNSRLNHEDFKLISSFRNLKYLQVDKNSLSAEDIEELCKLKELLSISVKNCALDARANDALAKMVSICSKRPNGKSLTVWR